jgi:hypothetical protein
VVLRDWWNTDWRVQRAVSHSHSYQSHVLTHFDSEEAMHYSQGVTGGAMGRAASRDAAIRRVRQAITSGHAKLVLPK